MKGQLVLVPTPIDNVSSLEPKAKNMLEQAVEDNDIICVEEIKEGRRRWIRFGLPRETIEDFVLYNEHTRDNSLVDELINKMKSGKNVFLMSDCGLPAFCDPGVKLVNRAHDASIKVTATPFPNSIALALAMSGFSHDKFMFEGFISSKSAERTQELKRIMKSPITNILMDTPYRMNKMIDEAASVAPNRMALMAMDLNQESELLIRGRLKDIKQKLKKDKREFILVLGPL